MAAPADTTRTTPNGKFLESGHSTKVAFSRDPDIALWEKSVTPPGIDGGDEIEITTMFNATVRTFASQPLYMLSEFKFTCSYDPDVYAAVIQLINQEGAITVHYPDGSKLTFYGYMKNFEPGENTREDQPEADVTVMPTNWDPVNRVEVGPVLTPIAGT